MDTFRPVSGREDNERARAILAGEIVRAQARQASSFVLCRDRDRAIEVYLLRRSQRLRFAAGRMVFPGGAVEASDGDDLPWIGRSPASFADELQVDEATAHKLVVAGVRETFEETGFLLSSAVNLGGSWTPNPLERETERRLVESGETSVGDLLRHWRMALDVGSLLPFGRWITPDLARVRFDATLFIAPVCGSSEPEHVSSEATESFWLSVPDALAAQEAGTMRFGLAQRRVLEALVEISSVDEVAALATDLVPHEPRLVESGGEVFLSFPDT